MARETREQRQQRFLERDLERKRREEGLRALPAQAGWMAGLMLPTSGLTDYFGLYPQIPTQEQMIPTERLPSFSENIANKRYMDAMYQTLGVLGDAAYASAPLTGGAGLLAGTALKAPGAIGKATKTRKGIASLAEKQELAKAIKERQQQAVRKYATDKDRYFPDKFISPTLEALIKRAPQNLKGKQISQWLDANANKGVKPKELEYLGIDEYIANNPNAKVSEVVEGVSENKVKIRKNYFEDDSDYRPTIEFETSLPDNDPLDGAPLHKYLEDEIRYSLEQKDPNEIRYFLDDAARILYGKPTVGAIDLTQRYENLDELSDWLKKWESSDDVPDMDELIDQVAKAQYDRSPYELIKPVSTGDIDANIGTNTFAFGNEETGYSIFVDGERIDLGVDGYSSHRGRTDNTPYSRTEAQMELRNAMEEGGDPLRIEGEYDDYYGDLHKQYVDENLPGGSNYREVSFSWANAPKSHNIGHIDDENQIAHALVRDRVLDDGTGTLHIDELQSDLHQQGSKFGYELSESVKKETVNKVNGLLEDTPYSYFEQGTFKGIIIPNKSRNRERTSVHLATQQRLPKDHDFISFEELEKELLRSIDNPRLYEDMKRILDKNPNHLFNPGIKETIELSETLGLDKVKELVKTGKPFIGQGKVPNYPFKDDWYNTGLKELLFDAIRDGKDALSISTSAAMKSRYTDRYHKFYESLYDQKIPSAMKKLAKKYGGKFEKGRLDIKDVGGEAYYNKHMEKIIKEQEEPIYKANIIKITPKMREKILTEGLPSFASGGIIGRLPSRLA